MDDFAHLDVNVSDWEDFFKKVKNTKENHRRIDADMTICENDTGWTKLIEEKENKENKDNG